MLNPNSIVPIVLAVGLLLSAGCQQQADATATDEDQQLLNDMLGELEDNGPRESRTAAASISREAAEPIVAKAHGDRLELRLQPGDRFPMIKTVEQMLVQQSETAPLTARTRLELTMALQVENVQADLIQLSVRYSRVSYSHDLGGHRLEFDSARHQGVIPQDAVPYAGMVNNGFAFQIGRNNRIQKLIGYQEFLERCVQDVPLARRQSLLTEIAQRFGDDGVANFIDDTIGLLPFNTDVDPDSATSVVVGDIWTRERRLMQPVPVHLTSTYRLVDLNQNTAEIDITGRIAAGTSVQSASTGSVTIQGGHAVGRCSVDRETGLPLELSVTQFVAMTAKTQQGVEVTQQKQVVTSIRTFPEMRGPVVNSQRSHQAVVPAGGAAEAGPGVTRIPTGTAGAAAANYPN